jgi:hypothetical protein
MLKTRSKLPCDKLNSIIVRKIQSSDIAWKSNSNPCCCLVTGNVISVNFLIYRPGNRVSIPVEFINEDANEDIKKGLFLTPINTFVECTCAGDIPEKFVLDVSTTPKRGVVRIDAIQFPPGVQPTTKVAKDMVLAIIKTPK